MTATAPQTLRDERRAVVDLRLLPAAAVAWLSAWVAVGLTASGAWLIAAGCGLAALTALVCAAQPAASAKRASKRPRDVSGILAGVALALLAGALSASIAAVQHPQRLPEPLVAALETSGRSEVTATVTSLAASSNGSLRVRATLESVDGVAARAPVLLFLAGEDAAPEIGTLVAGSVRLRGADAGDRVVALAFLKESLVALAPPHPLLAAGNELRTRFADDASTLPSPGGALVPGLAVGDERYVDDRLRDAMTVTSLTHLTAVSGSNIAIIVAGFSGFGRWMGWKRGVRIAVAGLAMVGFVLLVTPQGSVIRAAAMAGIVLALEARSRPVAGAPILALAVIALLAADPWLSRDYGFALSAAATAGLILGTRPCTAWLSRWLPEPIALLIAVPLVAQLACQPILVLLDATLPTYGVVANLLAAPAAPIATVVGLLACVVGPFVPLLGQVLLWVAWLPAHWIGLIAEVAAGLPFTTLPWIQGGVGALSFALVTVALVLLIGRVGGTSQTWRRLREATALLMAGIVVVVVAIVAGNHAVLVRDRPADWRVVACDVGQGDALLLRAGTEVILIDTGEEIAPLRACLDEMGVAAINLLILSHFDRDHSGAVPHLDVPVAQAWLPDTIEARDQPETRALLGADVTVHFAAMGDVVTVGDLRLEALWPKRRDGEPSRDESNTGSLVVLAEPTDACASSCLSVLLLGDADRRAQRRILSEAPAMQDGDVRVDVLKVSHHGSADVSAEFTATVRAQLGLISVGANNDYGHPNPALLGLLVEAGTPWLRTDERGIIVVASAPTASEELFVWTSRSAPIAGSARRSRSGRPRLGAPATRPREGGERCRRHLRRA